ncbi:MAG: S41 family peptidase, partial [Desulfopila sp.]
MQSKYIMKLSRRLSRLFVNIHPLRGLLAIAVVFPVLFVVVSSGFGEEPFDEKRNELIGYMLYKQLPSIHFSDKNMNDSLAKASFDLYLKQLDYQKRFLLQQDVAELSRYATAIDNNLKSGSTVLPEVGFAILAQRITEAKKIVTEILADGFDTSRKELYETDPDKLEYAGNSEDLRQRWRKILKAQVIGRYLDLVEEQKEARQKEHNARQDNGNDEAALWSQAGEKVAARNRTFFTRLSRQTLQDHYDRFFNAVTRAFDPHTNYLPPAKKEDFDIHMRGSLEGIGALLREEDGYIKVVRIIPGSAAERQGSLLAEDIILAVAQADEEPVEVTDMRLREAVRLIRGPKETEVRLTVKKPDGTTEIVGIVRDVVQIEETFVKSTVLADMGGDRIGYVKIPSFYRDFEMSRNNGEARNSTDDTRRALRRLADEDIDGLILDLRNDGGGSLLDAVDITGLFLKSGPVVQVKNSFGKRKVLRDTDDEIVYDGPLVVLVNLFSA